MSEQMPQLDWQEWMQRWDRQQAYYLPDREQRFTAMLDVLAALLPESFVALDLACGPGSISRRLLARFPQARCIALDFDPVLLHLGRQVLGDGQGRLRWVEADLRDSAWPGLLGTTQVAAVLSTTALHWLPAESLVQLYRQLGTLVRPGGLVLNGDNYAFGPHMLSFRQVAEAGRAARDATPLPAGTENWAQWWAALQGEPSMAPLFAERDRRFLEATHHGAATLVELHEAALRDAGFREVGVIWQHLDNRVVLAVR